MMILDKIKFSYEEAENPKSKQFTSNHTIFAGKIIYNRKSYKFEYQCNTDYVMPKLDEVMNCLIGDMEAYDNALDLTSFANEFGYSVAEAKNIYKECGRTSKALHRMFTDTELTEIEDDLYYCS